jgi:hypothetical protein
MNGPLRRLNRRRAATADESPPTTSAASEPVDGSATQPTAEMGAAGVPESGDATAVAGPADGLTDEERARQEERLRRDRDLPAGLDAAALERRSAGAGRRGAARRRIRHLRGVREILLRDLGGFVYEVHRTAGGHQHSGHRDILETKASRLAAIDAELRELEASLGIQATAGTTLVREPGIGGECPTCGELHASDAGYCARCGTALSERARRSRADDVEREIAARATAARDAELAREAEPAEAAEARRAEATAAAAAEPPTTELGTRNGGAGPSDEAGGGVAPDGEIAGGAAPDDGAGGGETQESVSAERGS